MNLIDKNMTLVSNQQKNDNSLLYSKPLKINLKKFKKI